MKKLNLFFLIGLLTFSSCAPEAQKVEVRHDPLVGIDLPLFPLEEGKDWVFTSNSFYLWKEKLNAHHVETVYKHSGRLDELGIQGSGLQKELKTKYPHVLKRVGELQVLKNKAIETKKKFDQETDPEKKRLLGQELGELQAVLNQKQLELAEIREKEPGFDQTLARINQIKAEAGWRLAKIKTVVDWYDQPPQKIVFQRGPSGSVCIRIENFILRPNTMAQSFYSEACADLDPQILNDPGYRLVNEIDFQDAGGRVSFQIELPDELYRFELERTSYGRLKDSHGRWKMTGNLFRESRRNRSSEPSREGRVSLTGKKP